MQSRSHPWSDLSFNCRNVADLVLLVQDQLLSDVEQRLELFEVGVPVDCLVT